MVELRVCYKDFTENHQEVEPMVSEVKNEFNFKPRGSLARALYEKHQTDEFLSQFDKTQWYHCNLNQVPEDLQIRFIQLNPDEDTIKFLQQSEEKSDWIPKQIWHSVVKAFLGWFMTQTSINGWLQRGSMFVLSQSQFLKLLRTDEKWHRETVLDLGAGDGEVTAHFASFFDRVYVTEVSGTMQVLLQKRGYELLDIETWYKNQKFDVISCLNLLDRCDTPFELLQQIKSAVKPDGLIVLAVVLPFAAYVESGSPDHRPKQLLKLTGSTFEQQVASIVESTFTPMGFEVVSWSRVPYLCEGDLKQSYYWLDDAVFILKVTDK